MERCPDCPCTSEQIEAAGGCPYRPGDPPEFVRPPEGWYWTMPEEEIYQDRYQTMQEKMSELAQRKVFWRILISGYLICLAEWLYKLLR